MSNKKYMGVNKADKDYDACRTKNLEKQLEYIDGSTQGRWTTYLAYLLKQDDIKDSKKIICKYEAILTQCSYLSRMAYTPAEIFCRMTKFLKHFFSLFIISIFFIIITFNITSNITNTRFKYIMYRQ